MLYAGLLVEGHLIPELNSQESFDSLYADLRTLASKCRFDYRAARKVEGAESLIDEMLRDRVVLGSS